MGTEASGKHKSKSSTFFAPDTRRRGALESEVTELQLVAEVGAIEATVDELSRGGCGDDNAEDEDNHGDDHAGPMRGLTSVFIMSGHSCSPSKVVPS